MALPSAQAVKNLLEGMLGRDVQLAPGTPVDMQAAPGPTTAVYVDDHLTMTSVVVADFPLVARIGASLGLVPAGAADDAIADGDLSSDLQENTAEMLNVFAAVLGDASGVHERLYQTFAAGVERPGDVAALSAATGMREDYAVDIKGYGKGLISIIAAA